MNFIKKFLGFKSTDASAETQSPTTGTSTSGQYISFDKINSPNDKIVKSKRDRIPYKCDNLGKKWILYPNKFGVKVKIHPFFKSNENVDSKIDLSIEKIYNIGRRYFLIDNSIILDSDNRSKFLNFRITDIEPQWIGKKNSSEHIPDDLRKNILNEVKESFKGFYVAAKDDKSGVIHSIYFSVSLTLK